LAKELTILKDAIASFRTLQAKLITFTPDRSLGEQVEQHLCGIQKHQDTNNLLIICESLVSQILTE